MRQTKPKKVKLNTPYLLASDAYPSSPEQGILHNLGCISQRLDRLINLWEEERAEKVKSSLE